MLKYALLGFLSYRPMSGYDMEHWMEASTGHFWHAKISQVYTTLKQVEQKYGKDVRFVWKNNPLPFHPRALPARADDQVAERPAHFAAKGGWDSRGSVR